MSRQLQSQQLRRATPADQAAIEALVQSAYAKWVPVIGREPMPMLTDYAVAIRDHRIDLLIDGETLRALIETALEPDHLFIVNIAVAPDAQGQGLGTRLLQHAEALAAEAGKTELRLCTNSLMAPNIALYRQRGYEVSHEERLPDRAVIHMTKTI
jgi:ribosomal protein S18 acetylase RimI-like enzyme